MFGQRFQTIAAGALIGFIAGYLIDSRRKARAPMPKVADRLTLLDPGVADARRRRRAAHRRRAAVGQSRTGIAMLLAYMGWRLARQVRDADAESPPDA